MSVPLNVAVIGLGRMGRLYAQTVATQINGARLYAIMEPDEGARKDVATHYAVAHAFVDAADVLARPEVDAVIIATPTSSHRALVIAAAQAGKAIFCEKPLAVSDTADLPRLDRAVTLWGIDKQVEHWLESHGIACQPFGQTAPDHNEIILVGDLSMQAEDVNRWQTLARRIAQGSMVVFLSPLAFKRGDDPVGWLPLVNKGRCYAFHDWLYHKECVSKTHSIFVGLQPQGIMDWDYYGPVIPHMLFDGQDTPDDVAAAAFAVGYSCPGGYASGVLVGSYHLGAGRFFLNTLHILEHVDRHPAADRLLLNLISTASQAMCASCACLPPDFDRRLSDIGYR